MKDDPMQSRLFDHMMSPSKRAPSRPAIQCLDSYGRARAQEADAARP